MRRSPSRRRFLAGIGAASTAALAGSPTSASAARPPAPTKQPLDSDIERLVDELVETSLAEHDVPGASIAVVSDGSRTVTKGYGVADRTTESPVDPEETPFRIGSVSKPVVATALMELVESDVIDPDADVARYLDVPIDERENEAVTLSDLVTHRGGFESTNRGMWIPNEDDLRPLESYLRNDPQRRVRPPGRIGSYSNFGYALAGQVLAAHADEPFHRAIDDHLLQPAGMTTSSFRQPLPSSLAEAHATGYGPTERYRQGEFPLLGLRPAGSMSATASDMGRFLELHLNDGVLDGERVLGRGTIGAMHERWATHHDRLSGMAFGLIEKFRGDVRTLWHNGATLSFYSHLVLVPEYDFGLFVSFNAPAGSAAATDVVDGVLDELLPNPETASRTPDGPPHRADEIAGTYRSTQRSHTWHDRVTSALNAATIDVHFEDDGTLVTDRDTETERWVEIEPLVFERTDGNRRIAFGREEGAIRYLFYGGSPTAFARVEGLDRLSVHGMVVAATVLGTLSALVGWPASALYHRVLTGGESAPQSWQTAVTNDVVRAKLLAIGSIGVLYVSSFTIVVHFLATPLVVLSDPPTTFRALFVGTSLGAVGTIATAGVAGYGWICEDWDLFTRTHYAVVTASLVGICWLLWYWNLLFPPGLV
ncbi:CubicO group peptidase, beta-lactamase class C family [Halopelagius inordinatus]|uniref:CubicO group peptidase, beta-lactamase class C family n=1 Tax=Halopelagius inordinatus TaxID=553467 RepID=A0A1I2VNY7_9EURY|nr:serine hydrolase domain-containing protein [Halopelagius inordinatus]SFG90109.1 CubicO group peptidase, beta-lactamase class C family [Halopelagius inordinatus]